MNSGNTLQVIDVHCGWGRTIAARGWEDPAQVRAALAARGIHTAFVASDLAHRYDPIAGNEAVASAVTQPDADVDLRGWIVVHPSRMNDANEQMRRYLFSERFVGMALYPDPITGYPVTSRDVQEVLASFRRYSKPVLIETPTAAAMAEAAQIAQDYAGVRFIASGMGGDEWREAVLMAAKPLNLFMDISGSLSTEKLEHALTVLAGPRKLLFGSGAPDTDPAAVLGMLFEVPMLSAEDRARILYSNAARLFRLVDDVEEEEGPDPNAGGPSLRPLNA